MTEANISIDGNHITIDVHGHSGYADSGADIVCAGVSALTDSLFSLIDSLDETGDVTINSATISDGAVNLDITDNTGALKYPLVMYHHGLIGIEQQYYQFLLVEWGEK